VVEKLGQGAFSIVFKGKNVVTGKEVAIKVSKDPEQRLKHESKILAYLNRERVTCVPTLYWYGACGSNSCLATTLYTEGLKPVQMLYKALTLCSQIVSGLQAIHCAGIVHTDIKPDNIMLDDRGRIQIIDFGLSSLIYNRDKGVMQENVLRENLVGSCKYASYNLHLGNSPSFRDDLISAGYVMMWLQGIALPWARETAFPIAKAPVGNDVPLETQNNKEGAGGNVVIRPSEPDGPAFGPLSKLPLYHINHPDNVERAKRKQLVLNIENKHMSAYFNMVYKLKYEEIPKYNDYLVLFSTL
jgi:serine/threonine protein kinase